MTLYRKKSVVVEAMQITGGATSIAEASGWMLGYGFQDFRVVGSMAKVDDFNARVEDKRFGIEIDTLEGTMHADPGDWIIRGTRGEFYPCKPGPFEDTFEKVEEG